MKLGAFEKSILCLVLCLLIGSNYCLASGGKGVPVGSTIKTFDMEAPSDATALEYLGIKEDKTFTLSQISGKLILVEFYSMYCPVCQRQAPRTNKLYKFIQDDPALAKDIKVIGIGLTNKQKEIDIYRKTFRVKFPLIADPEKAIADKTGIKDIPLTALVDKNGKVLLSHLGVIEKMDKFLEEIRKIHKKQ